MKGIKKALAAILSLAVMVSIAPQAVFAGNSDRYEKVAGMQTTVADAEIHVYAPYMHTKWYLYVRESKMPMVNRTCFTALESYIKRPKTTLISP